MANLLLLLFPLLAVGVQADFKEIENAKLHYTSDGIVFARFYSEDPNTPQNRTLNATLFFFEEKQNRQIFNMDVCVDFHDRKEPDPELRSSVTTTTPVPSEQMVKPKEVLPQKADGKVVICYKGNDDLDWEQGNGTCQGNELEREMCDIAAKCGYNRNDAQGAKNHGIKLVFSPPIYKFFSLVDRTFFEVNTTDYDEDEIRIFRKNQMAKYCLRFELGRVPPSNELVETQRAKLEEGIRNIIEDADIRNRTDNISEIMREAQITLEVETEPTLECSLKTDDLQYERDVSWEGELRESKLLQGLFLHAQGDEEQPEDGPKNYQRFTSKKLYSDLVKTIATDRNYQSRPTPRANYEFLVHVEGVRYLNFSFSPGNLYPCRTEWVDLEKFTMERDFYHPVIHEHFAPVHIAYTVGLVNWKNLSKADESGYGPGKRKKGRVGPGKEEIADLRVVMANSEGFLGLDQHLRDKFGGAENITDEVFEKLEDYYTRLDLNNDQPLTEVTVKQMVFHCGMHSFNLPHVATSVEGEGDLYI